MNEKDRTYRGGLLTMLLCQLLWGALPIYWKALIPIDSFVIIFYRVLLVAVCAFIAARARYPREVILAPLRDRKKVLVFLTAGLIITVNWSVYIWAVNAGKIVQTSIGYYIEPLVICMFGIVIFREKLTAYKTAAIGLACVAVVIILVHFGQLPGIALVLAGTFAVYSAIKKTVTEPALISLLYETVFLVPFALARIIYIETTGQGALSVGSPAKFALLMLVGVATVAPMALFSTAAQRIPLFVIGIMSYISPSIQLFLGVKVFGESLDKVQIIAFVIIWIGLVIFSYGEFRQQKSE